MDPATHKLLRWPQRELIVTISAQMDDRKIRIFHGYRAQYNYARVPVKGRLRWYPEETIDTVRAACLVSIARAAEVCKLRGWV